MNCVRCGNNLTFDEKYTLGYWCFECDSVIGHFTGEVAKQEDFKFKVGDMANGRETSEEIIEVSSYVRALEELVERSNLYIEKIDK